MSSGKEEANGEPVPSSFWRRRIAAPIIGQLRQGIRPETIAITIALGLVLGIFPILGSTTLLCGLAALALRLNQPVIHVVNYAAYPLQILLLLPFYRAGESLFGQEHTVLSIPLLFARFRADFIQFLKDFGLLAVHGIIVWALIAPVATALIYFTLRDPLRVLARRLSQG